MLGYGYCETISLTVGAECFEVRRARLLPRPLQTGFVLRVELSEKVEQLLIEEMIPVGNQAAFQA